MDFWLQSLGIFNHCLDTINIFKDDTSGFHGTSLSSMYPVLGGYLCFVLGSHMLPPASSQVCLLLPQFVPLCTQQTFSPIIYHRNRHSHLLYSRLLMNSCHSATGTETEKNCLLLLSFHLSFLTLVVVLFSLVHYFCELLRRHTLPGGKTFLQV